MRAKVIAAYGENPDEDDGVLEHELSEGLASLNQALFAMLGRVQNMRVV